MQQPIRIIDGCSPCKCDLKQEDLEFLVTNKITKIINCAAKHIPNHWESIGIQYLSYQWLESETQFPFDYSNCFTFINDTLEVGEAVLVHSIRASNRSVFVIVLFLMRKFKWTLQKTLQYIQNLKKKFEIKSNVYQQLLNYEKWLHLSKLSNNWDAAHNDDEKLARNTYLNSQRTYLYEPKKKKEISFKKVQWKKNLVSQFIPPYQQIQFKKFSTPQPKIQPSQIPIKLRVLPSDNNWMNKKYTLNQIVDEQLQKQLNLYSIKSDRQSIKSLARPSTAPSKRLLKGKVLTSSHRLLVKQS
ncbi:unnamed protein product [Paramecium sonneborni]|uniref:Tyrosine-protein phosphatase domain-containing protein n=1 Tax=Paramecium sonneborni TaxID=65129 RepID=A0A8S1PEZ7_9CILI|nr:unnamed protein product [Paramecium sonneborni]